MSVESVDGIVPCHLRHKKKSTPLEVFKMDRVEILKTLPQQLTKHKKMICYTRNENKTRRLQLLCLMDKKPSSHSVCFTTALQRNVFIIQTEWALTILPFTKRETSMIKLYLNYYLDFFLVNSLILFNKSYATLKL